MFWWTSSKPAGTRAFILDLRDCDECYSDLKIFLSAWEEAKHISIEYIEHFGVGMIGEREKECLPFVNMCLRAWVKKLSDDVDLWEDLTSLDFDKWLLLRR